MSEEAFAIDPTPPTGGQMNIPPGGIPVPIVKGKVAMPALKAKVVPAKPEGWWQLNNLSGSLEGVCEEIAGRLDVPEYWKRAIMEDLRVRCVGRGTATAPEFNFVYVDAQLHVERGNAVLHFHAVPDKKLL